MEKGGFFMRENEKTQEELSLKMLISAEDLAEKKTKIYARLLMEASLAKEMEEVSLHHQKRKKQIESLLFAQTKKKKGDEGDEA